MANTQAYRELITSIKTMGVDNVSPQDKKVLLDLLKNLKYIAEFRLLKQCYDKDQSMNNLLPLVDNKINDLQFKISELESKKVSDTGLSQFEEIKLKALTVTCSRYVEIKKVIVTRKFDHYVNFMNTNINNANQIIAVCSGVLDQANIDYAKEFVINGSEKTAVDLIYDLKNQPDLAHELTVFFNRRRHYTVDNEERVRADQKFLNYLDIIKDNENLVREFMDAVFVIGTSENDKEVIVRERLSKNKLRLADLNKNFLACIKNGKEIASLEASIKRDEDELDNIEEAKNKFEFILSDLDKIGLHDFATQFVSPTANIDESVEQRVVDFVKTSMRRRSFDIREVKTKIEEEVRFLESQIVRKEELLDGSYSVLNSYGQELVKKYPNETENLLNVVNDKLSADVTPILAAYALKALMDSKSININGLNELTHAYDKSGIEALVSGYEAVVKNTALSIHNALGDVTNRAMFDSSPYEELKIR